MRGERRRCVLHEEALHGEQDGLLVLPRDYHQSKSLVKIDSTYLFASLISIEPLDWQHECFALLCFSSRFMIFALSHHKHLCVYYLGSSDLGLCTFLLF